MPCSFRQRSFILGVLVVLLGSSATTAKPLSDSDFQAMIGRYCADCHSHVEDGQLALASISHLDVAAKSEAWEKVVRKIEARQMPPVDEERPSEADYQALTHYLVTRLDAATAKVQNPGHIDAIRRLNRTEYQNAIRDLLAVELDVASLLPADESSHGFDHITVSDLPPGLLTRYVQAAQKISRLAVGSPLERPEGVTYRIQADTTQEQHVPGLPFGTRGGRLFRHTFARAGVYEVQIQLTRDRNDEVEGLHGTHQLEVLIDDARVGQFLVRPPKSGRAADFDDSQLVTRIEAPAGPHDLGVTFVQQRASLEETKRQPLNVHFNLHRHPRLTPAIYEVSITGPFATDDSPAHAGDTPSRRRIFIARPDGEDDAETAASQVLAAIARRAYRRPVDDADLDRLMDFFRQGHEQGGYEAGIESALAAVLTSPHFLFKIERAPSDAVPGTPLSISDVELASRLSFFLWSSIPDDELLGLAERGELRKPDVLESQVKRMLADDRAANLATNFADQWLHLRNLESIRPDGRLYPDFDDNLRQAMRRETQMHVQEMIVEDGSLLDLIRADHTYLNERLAKHYDVPHVYGSRFRRFELPAKTNRGGLLRHGSVLTVTSYATRTSPVIRGNWVLKNMLGAPAPPPPADVPSLEDQKVISEALTVRERLSKHREHSACASCHNLMDPVGFSLENFDAVGQWRDLEAGKPVDTAGGLPNGSTFDGVAGLEDAILKRPQLFVTATTEKLMTFALGRGVELSDGAAIRKIVRDAAKNDYRFSALVLGIVRSEPFQMRTTP